MNKKAYTLLEMIVVVMIISILFLLTIPNIAKVLKVVDDRACEAMTKVVDSAIIEFRLEYGTSPNSLNDLIQAGYLNHNQGTCADGRVLRIVNGHTIYE